MSLDPVRTKDEARARGRRGGLASGAARRLKRDARATLEMLLSGKVEYDGKNVTRMQAMCMALIARAMDGNPQAFNAILDRLEGKPTNKVAAGIMPLSRVVDFEAPEIKIHWIGKDDETGDWRETGYAEFEKPGGK